MSARRLMPLNWWCGSTLDWWWLTLDNIRWVNKLAIQIVACVVQISLANCIVARIAWKLACDVKLLFVLDCTVNKLTVVPEASFVLEIVAEAEEFSQRSL